MSMTLRWSLPGCGIFGIDSCIVNDQGKNISRRGAKAQRKAQAGHKYLLVKSKEDLFLLRDDCMDAGGSAQKIGAIGDAGAVAEKARACPREGGG